MDALKVSESESRSDRQRGRERGRGVPKCRGDKRAKRCGVCLIPLARLAVPG